MQATSRRAFALCAVLVGCGSRAAPSTPPAPAAVTGLTAPFGPLRHVNPLIGTQGAGSDYGGMIPGVTRPFGMTQWTAVTREHRVSVCPYHHDDRVIRGFLGTHQPAIWMGDYGQVELMPGIGAVTIEQAIPFRHEREIARPNYYAVDLEASGGTIRAELTATERAGILRFTFPPGQPPFVVVEAIRSAGFVGHVGVRAGASEIEGWNPDRQSAHLGPALPNFRGYFVARFDRPFASFGTWDGNGTRPGVAALDSTYAGAYATFAPDVGAVTVKIGTSFISVEQARANLEAEIPAWDFDAVVRAGEETWNAALGRISVEGGSDEERVNLYTGMYHSLLYPRIFSEGGRYYSAFDDRVHDGVSYNDYSLWDTFRAQHPLLILIAPERVEPMITALVQMFVEGGRMPIWPNPTETNIMVSTHAECVIADAFVKGLRGYDVNKAYAAARKDAMVPPDGDATLRWEDRLPWTGRAAPSAGAGFEARGGLTWYQSLGYVPADRTNESVSRTIEFGVDDYCTAQVARELAPADHKLLMARSRNYQHLYNPATRMLAAKDSRGGWWPDPKEGFTEGSPWTYLFGAMHDPAGMIEMMGGRDAFIARLDENFAGGHYRHDNEPGHHYPYLYDHAGQPWKTQKLVRELLATKYRNAPDGLAGNDDCGQMSAWYIFGAMGLYPVTPGSGTYAIGSPLFDRITLRLTPPLGSGTFVVVARHQAPANIYVQAVTLNGKPLETPFLSHADLARGGSVLEFTMGPTPRTTWGTAPR